MTNVETQIKTKIIRDQFDDNVANLFSHRQFNFQSSKNQKTLYSYFHFFFHLHVWLKNIVAFHKFGNLDNLRWKREKRDDEKSNLISFLFFISSDISKLIMKTIEKQMSIRFSQIARSSQISRITILRQKKKRDKNEFCAEFQIRET